MVYKWKVKRQFEPKKIEPVKTVETHSFSLLTHNLLAIKKSKPEQPLYRCNLFDPSWSSFPPTCVLHPLPLNHILLNFLKMEKIKYCPKTFILTKNQQLPQNPYVNQNCPEISYFFLSVKTNFKFFFIFWHAAIPLSTRKLALFRSLSITWLLVSTSQ